MLTGGHDIITLGTRPLFRPLRVRGWELPNRIVMPPMVVHRGLTTPQAREWYGRHARGGVGLVIVEATGLKRFESELTAETLKPLVEAIHEGGALAAIQLKAGFPLVADRLALPAEVTREAIEEIVERFRLAAGACTQAGFDGLELHGAHDHLLDRFFSPVRNLRGDEYGGPLENRMRLPLRVAEAVRPLCSADGRLLLYRHTPVGPGYGLEESLVLAERLVEAGVDILDISPAGGEKPGEWAAPFMQFGVPVIAVGELGEVPRALEILNGGRADLVAIGRGLIADPDWPRKVREGRQEEIVRCTRCNEKCYGHLRLGLPIECTQWG